MKAAVIQIKATDNKQENINKAVIFVKKAIAKKAEFILLPELFVYKGKLSKAKIQEISEFIPGETSRMFSEIAKKHKANILLGSLHEKTTKRKKVFNTSILINSKGAIQSKYRKINLFDAKIGSKQTNESKNFLPGKEIAVTRMKEFNVGTSICYDLRFPEIFLQYKRKKVGIICLPSAFTYQTGKAHWEVLLRARAIENSCYILAPNQVGRPKEGIASYGKSMIIDPWGKILAKASGIKEETIFAEIDKARIIKTRNCFEKERKHI